MRKDRTSRRQYKTGVEPTSIKAWPQPKRNSNSLSHPAFKKEAIKPIHLLPETKETRNVLGELPCLYLETTHHKPAELEDSMKIV